MTQSFDAWYRERFGDLVRLATLLVGSEEIARDLTQDAMVRVLRHWPRIDEPDHYARRAVINACHSHHRRRAMMRRHDERGATPTSATVTSDRHDEVTGTGLDDELLAALARLPERQRTVIVLRYWADLPELEIAATLASSRPAVASLLHRGLATLRDAVQPLKGVEP